MLGPPEEAKRKVIRALGSSSTSRKLLNVIIEALLNSENLKSPTALYFKSPGDVSSKWKTDSKCHPSRYMTPPGHSSTITEDSVYVNSNGVVNVKFTFHVFPERILENLVCLLKDLTCTWPASDTGWSVPVMLGQVGDVEICPKKDSVATAMCCFKSGGLEACWESMETCKSTHQTSVLAMERKKNMSDGAKTVLLN